MFRKSFSIAIIAFLLVFTGMLPAQASTGTAACGTSGTYHVTGTVVDSSSYCTGDVSFDEDITAIGPGAFDNFRYGANSHSALTSITFGDNITTIDYFAFRYSTSALTSLTIPNSVTEIGRYAFTNFNNPPSLLASITLGDHIQGIGEQAFSYNPAIVSVTLPNSLSWVGTAAFYRTGITSLRIPSSMRSISSRAFEGMENLTIVYLEDGITVIGSEAFIDDKEITSIRLPETLTEIEYSAFGSAIHLTEIRIPNSVDTLGDEVFSRSYDVTSIYIGTGLRWIGAAVFASDWAPTPNTLQCLTNNSVVTAQQLFDAGIEIAVPACAQPAQQAVAAPYIGPIIGGQIAKIANATSESEFTLTGERMSQITSVVLDGKSITIVSKSDSKIVVRLPSHAIGFVNLVLKSESGSLTYQDAFEYKDAAAALPVTVLKTLAIAKSTTKSITAAQRQTIVNLSKSATTISTMTCTATYRKSAGSADIQNAKALASAACAIAKQTNPLITTKVLALVSSSSSQRKVLLALTR